MHIHRISGWRRLLWLVFFAPLAACADRGELMLEDAWVRPLPPGMGMTAAYGLLRNAGDESLVLVSYASAQFDDVSLHRTEVVDGVSRMREVGEVVLEPGASLALEPGGHHLMLMKPRAPLGPDQAVRLTVETRDGRRFEFDLPVERR